jgi:uncharacterized Zn finger protein
MADEVTGAASAASAWQQQASDPQGFWRGRVPLPTKPEAVIEPGHDRVSAVLVKKAGDFPPFWDRDQSFIAVMDELYRRIESKNRRLL